jgi:hypothetical protein
MSKMENLSVLSICVCYVVIFSIETLNFKVAFLYQSNCLLL